MSGILPSSINFINKESNFLMKLRTANSILNRIELGLETSVSSLDIVNNLLSTNMSSVIRLMVKSGLRDRLDSLIKNISEVSMTNDEKNVLISFRGSQPIPLVLEDMENVLGVKKKGFFLFI